METLVDNDLMTHILCIGTLLNERTEYKRLNAWVRQGSELRQVIGDILKTQPKSYNDLMKRHD